MISNDYCVDVLIMQQFVMVILNKTCSLTWNVCYNNGNHFGLINRFPVIRTDSQTVYINMFAMGFSHYCSLLIIQLV